MSLQREMKFMIQRNDADDKSDNLVEAEKKNKIRELTEENKKLERENEQQRTYIEKIITYHRECVKKEQEELEKQKRMATTNQSKKGYCENTSEDEAISKERRTRCPPRIYSSTSLVPV